MDGQMTPGDDRTHVQLGRIDTKLDVLISQHSSLAGMVADHELRIRSGEISQHKDDERLVQMATVQADHETRIRAADRWRYALPISAIIMLLTAAGSIFSAIITVLRGH